MKAIAKLGGVIGLSCKSAMVNKGKDQPTVYDLVKHAEDIAGLVGIDYVGLGPDHLEFELPVNPWAPAPGWLGGSFTGSRILLHFWPEEREGVSPVRETLSKAGFSAEDIKKVLAANWLRLYRKVLG